MNFENDEMKVKMELIKKMIQKEEKINDFQNIVRVE